MDLVWNLIFKQLLHAFLLVLIRRLRNSLQLLEILVEPTSYPTKATFCKAFFSQNGEMFCFPSSIFRLHGWFSSSNPEYICPKLKLFFWLTARRIVWSPFCPKFCATWLSTSFKTTWWSLQPTKLLLDLLVNLAGYCWLFNWARSRRLSAARSAYFFSSILRLPDTSLWSFFSIAFFAKEANVMYG
mgnify:CR=1 FL=1